METLRFLVRGTAEKPFEVVVRKRGGKIAASCSCPAGETGRYCRHSLDILSGNALGVVSHNSGQVDAAAGWLWGSKIVDPKEVMAEDGSADSFHPQELSARNS